jgi:hypothetical protein
MRQMPSLLVELVEVDGQVMANAPWLAEPVTGATGDEALQKALAKRFEGVSVGEPRRRSK